MSMMMRSGMRMMMMVMMSCQVDCAGEEGGIADSDRARIFCKFVGCRAGDCQISNVIVF